MKVKIMYHGERVGWAGKIYRLYKSKDGEEHHFSGKHHTYFGCIYEMIDDRLKIRPEEIEDENWRATEKERTEYEAQKIVVRAARLERLKAMKLKKPHADITRAVNLLRPFFTQLNRVDQNRFTSYLANEMSKKAGKKK